MAAIARQIIETPIEQEMTTSYVRYAMSVIIGRAFPDVRDGLKPVHRRILYAMHDEGLLPDRRRAKSAATVGEVLKKYHPHGDQAVYDTLVRMAQDFTLRYPLVDGQGNLGCFTGDTKVRLLDGRDLSFEELAQEFGADKVFYVYSVDRQGNVTVGRACNPRITRRKTRIVELTLDTGEKIRCTPDHRFLLRDGTYKEAQHLTESDSLMPGYFRTAPVKEGLNDYLMIQQPCMGEWEFVHHLVDRWNEEQGRVTRPRGAFVRHHPEIYERLRYNNAFPRFDNMLKYSPSLDAMLEEAATYNHRVVAKRWLDERADVWDITVEEHHNFLLGCGVFVHNSVDGDSPAQMRYTEARLAPIAMELLRDIDQETVDFMPNYDESTTEPTVLPSTFPNLLVNGSQGIGVGMATNIPPHNLGEVCDAVSHLIDHSDATIDQLMKIIPGPDFPTAAMILGTRGIREAYTTGRGSITLQARAVIEPMERGQNAILITELPYQQNKAVLIEQIARLVREKKMPEGISEIRDESDRTGLRVVIELKRDTNPHVILNHLYKHTSLRQTFGIINLSIVDAAPRILTLKETLEYFIKHRQDVITRRTQFQLKKAQARAHILEGFRIILRHLDAVVALIRAARNREEARQGLRSRFNLSDEQANAVLNMQLGQLTQLDQQRIQDEYAEILKEIEMLEGILADPRRILHIIKEDMRRIKREYGDERRTQIRVEEAADIKIEDLIAQEDMVITVTRDGYIKRLPVDTYRTQGRGGKGMIGLTKKEEDAVQHLFIANTHSQIFFFTNKGRVHQLRAFEVPAASRQARGTPIINLVQTEPGEKITATIPVRDFKQKGFLFMTTKLGTVKKTPLEEFDTRYSKGLIAITLEDKDELRWVAWTDGKREIALGTREGMSIRFPESDVRAMGRPAAGVIGMRLDKGDYIIGMDVVKKGHDLLVVSEAGYGKRTDIDEYRIQSRGGSGVLTMKVTDKNGALVDLLMVHPEDELLIITQRGVVIRQKVENISQVGRNTQGVRLIRLDERDKVSAVARIVREQEE